VVGPGGRYQLPPGAPSLDRVKAGRGSSVCQVDEQPGDLVGVTEIGDLLGVSRQRAAQLSRLEGFPEPAAVLSAGRIWRRIDVEAWARATGRLS
jgi:prophage regulatory protein